ncbi:CLUMA_CG005702, isoform A [Clunio marinus]|uniref:CLUMA_CG005702, isoform A n=1 Tax=Clunio marinus TaxID=568069 RepID=A0A1J1HVY3_9DIPT|nr:CLUMA_CG005702, isoform A [Clunio marinus]
MGTRNRAFYGDDDDGNYSSRREIEEIPTISKTTEADGAQITKFAETISGLNLNDYATRKTIAQGMLDLALLTANAAQLKRVMSIGDEYKFYYFLMTLIIISISLQVVQAIIMAILAIVFDLNKVEEHRRTNIANNILLIITIISVAINIIISTFDIADIGTK